MSTTAYRRALLRKVNQGIDTSDRMIARERQSDKGNNQAIDYYRGFREAQIEMLCLISDMEDGL